MVVFFYNYSSRVVLQELIDLDYWQLFLRSFGLLWTRRQLLFWQFSLTKWHFMALNIICYSKMRVQAVEYSSKKHRCYIYYCSRLVWLLVHRGVLSTILQLLYFINSDRVNGNNVLQLQIIGMSSLWKVRVNDLWKKSKKKIVICQHTEYNYRLHYRKRIYFKIHACGWRGNEFCLLQQHRALVACLWTPFW